MEASTKKNVFASALLASSVLLLLCVLLIIGWVQSLEPFKIHINTTYKSIEIPAEKHQEQQVETIRYPSGVFDTSFASSFRESHENKGIARQSASEADPVSNTLVNGTNLVSEAPQTPLQYTKVKYPYFDKPVYVFMNENGELQYRVCIERVIEKKKVYGFVPAATELFNQNLTMVYDENAEFINITEESFGEIEPVNAPESLTKSLMKEYGKTGVYYKINRKGNKEYFVYGHYKNGKNNFFIADTLGNMIPGTLPIYEMGGD